MLEYTKLLKAFEIFSWRNKEAADMVLSLEKPWGNTRRTQIVREMTKFINI